MTAITPCGILLVGVAAALPVLAACAGPSEPASSPDTHMAGSATSSSPADAPASNHEHAPSSTVNGEELPGRATKVVRSTLLVDTADSQGQQVLVYRDARAAGTRTPVHVHPYGGTTCLLKGQMTLFLEGFAPRTAKRGECYYMPAGPAMSGYNSGDRTAVFIDSFTVSAGQEVWEIIEPGKEYIGGQLARPPPPDPASERHQQRLVPLGGPCAAAAIVRYPLLAC